MTPVSGSIRGTTLATYLDKYFEDGKVTKQEFAQAVRDVYATRNDAAQDTTDLLKDSPLKALIGSNPLFATLLGDKLKEKTDASDDAFDLYQSLGDDEVIMQTLFANYELAAGSDNEMDWSEFSALVGDDGKVDAADLKRLNNDTDVDASDTAVTASDAGESDSSSNDGNDSLKTLLPLLKQFLGPMGAVLDQLLGGDGDSDSSGVSRNRGAVEVNDLYESGNSSDNDDEEGGLLDNPLLLVLLFSMMGGQGAGGPQYTQGGGGFGSNPMAQLDAITGGGGGFDINSLIGGFLNG